MRYWAFDLDGTLVDSFSFYFRALQEYFSRQGKTFSDDLRHDSITIPVGTFLSTHLGPEESKNAFQYLTMRSKDDAHQIQIFEGLETVIEGLHQGGARIAIWTNRDKVSAQQLLTASGLIRYIETVVSGTCLTHHKPHPEGIYKIAAGFGVSPSEICMVGDHEMDMHGAKAAGAKAVRASWHRHWKTNPCTVADHQFYDVPSFGKWVETQFIL